MMPSLVPIPTRLNSLPILSSEESILKCSYNFIKSLVLRSAYIPQNRLPKMSNVIKCHSTEADDHSFTTDEMIFTYSVIFFDHGPV